MEDNVRVGSRFVCHTLNKHTSALKYMRLEEIQFLESCLIMMKKKQLISSGLVFPGISN